MCRLMNLPELRETMTEMSREMMRVRVILSCNEICNWSPSTAVLLHQLLSTFLIISLSLSSNWCLVSKCACFSLV